MVNKSYIQTLIDSHLEGTELFLVELNISTTNKIAVTIDSFQGVTIEECIALSRQIEGNLDREADDFELEVSSAGIDQPFKLLKQYEKHLGEQVKVISLDGQTYKGKLLSCNPESFEILTEKKVKVEGKKKKQVVTETLRFEYPTIKSTKLEITFK